MSAPSAATGAPAGGILARLGLGSRPLRAWAMYDWANSAIFTVIVTAVFPIFYAKVAAEGLPGPTATARLGVTTTVALVIAVLLSPVVGAIADVRPLKKVLLGIGVAVGTVATALLAAAGPGDWLLALAAFAVVNVAVSASMVTYDALLPHLAPPEDLDRASSAGYALGYLGGGLALAIALVAVLKPEWVGLGALAARVPSAPTRVAFVGVALWWALFTVPLMRRVPEPPAGAHGDGPDATGAGVGDAVRGAFAGLLRTIRALGGMRDARLFLIAFILYNDAISTIIRMATAYGAELGLAQGSLIGAILLVQFVGIPFAFAFGWLATRIGAKRAILLALVVYGIISAIAYGLTTEREFWVLAVLVATVQGGAQALSRSLYASLVPASRSGEFFGLFSVFNRFGGVVGPSVMAVITQATGSSRLGIVSVVAFFAAGGVLLARVRVERGRAQALAMDAGAAPRAVAAA